MIDPESLYFRGVLKVLLDLYQVSDPRSLQEYLCRHTELAPVLLEVHYIGRPFFDNGLPIELTLEHGRLIVYFGITENLSLKKAGVLLRRVQEKVAAVSRPEFSLIELEFQYQEDPYSL